MFSITEDKDINRIEADDVGVEYQCDLDDEIKTMELAIIFDFKAKEKAGEQMSSQINSLFNLVSEQITGRLI